MQWDSLWGYSMRRNGVYSRQEAVMEIGNIIISLSIASIANTLKGKITLSTPIYTEDSLPQILSKTVNNDLAVLVVRTALCASKRDITSVPMEIVILTGEYRVAYWNLWLEQKTGIPVVQATGKTLKELYPDFENKRFTWAMENVLNNHSPQVMSQSLNHFLLPIPINNRGRHGLSLNATARANRSRAGTSREASWR